MNSNNTVVLNTSSDINDTNNNNNNNNNATHLPNQSLKVTFSFLTLFKFECSKIKVEKKKLIKNI